MIGKKQMGQGVGWGGAGGCDFWESSSDGSFGLILKGALESACLGCV